MKILTTAPAKAEFTGGVYCPICTRTVEAVISVIGKTAKVKPGQKCPRCSSSLDAGYVFQFNRAA